MQAFKEIREGKANSLLGAFGITAVAAMGGFLAGRVRGILAGFAPTTKGAGTIGVFLVAMGLHYFARDFRAFSGLIGDAASGMAGFVGNDLWFVIRAMVKWGMWKPETEYKAGTIILYEKDGKSEYYKAEKDIPATPVAEPGRDSRWVRFEVANAVSIDEITSFAQALGRNDALLDGIVKEQLLIFGPELAQAFGRELNQDEANNIYSGMRDSLKSVVMKFSSAA